MAVRVPPYYNDPGTTDWANRGIAGWETGTWVEPPSIEERMARALERIAAALERLAPNRPNFTREPFEGNCDAPLIDTGDDVSTGWITTWGDPPNTSPTTYTTTWTFLPAQ